MEIAALLVEAVRWWGIAGAVVAAAFLLVGIDRVDGNARGAYTFRPLLIPGVLLLWPLVLWRWVVLETGRDDWAKRHAPPRASHAVVWVVLAVAIVAIFAGAQALKQTWPSDRAPERLAAPQESVQ